MRLLILNVTKNEKQMKNCDAKFGEWALGFSGCDGGDIGTPASPSTWFCGIEWGGGHPPDEQELRDAVFTGDVAQPTGGYQSDENGPGWRNNLNYIFNWQAMKLLAAINGSSVSTYKEFAEAKRPFTKGEQGYFKLNLFPLSFRNTSHELWEAAFARATGLEKKSDYLDWIRANRFPIMKSWVEKYSPTLIICVGITFLSDYKTAFVDEGLELNCKLIDDKQLHWAFNRNGTLVVVIPFMVNRYGLTKNVSIQKFGNEIRVLQSLYSRAT